MNRFNRGSSSDQESRRSFVRKAIYVAPLVVSLKAAPAFASYGSGRPAEADDNRGKGNSGNGKGNNGVGNGWDPQPPGNPPVNDGVGTGPGNPGNRRRRK